MNIPVCCRIPCNFTAAELTKFKSVIILFEVYFYPACPEGRADLFTRRITCFKSALLQLLNLQNILRIAKFRRYEYF